MVRRLLSALLAACFAAFPALAAEKKPHIVFVLAEVEYNAAETLPKFAKEELADRFELSFVISHDKKSIPGLEKLREADLAVFYIHRRELPDEQLKLIREYIAAGKPLVALRTTSHAFETWKEFDGEVLGCHYNMHHGNKGKDNPTYVKVVPEQVAHPIVAGLSAEEFTVPSWLYKSQPLADTCTCLMTGRVGDKPVEPVAWINTAANRRIFYTMMGHPDDFALPAFRRLLINAIQWSLDLPSAAWPSLQPTDQPGPVTGTKLFKTDADIASELVSGVDRFCEKQIEQAVRTREKYWKRDFSSPEAYAKSIEGNRRRLAQILGLVDPIAEPSGFVELPWRATMQEFDARMVYWNTIRSVRGVGLQLDSTTVEKAVAGVVILQDGLDTPDCYDRVATPLLRLGYRVVIPMLIDRRTEDSRTVAGTVETGLTHRELIYRPAFELGRHLIGYEVAKAIAAVRNLKKSGGDNFRVGVIGLGDGGMIALFAAALSPDIDAVAVGGRFGPREKLWSEPIDHNVFGLLREFGDAETAAMIWPRKVVLDGGQGEGAAVLPGGRGGPGRDRTPDESSYKAELSKLESILGRERSATTVSLAAGQPEAPTKDGRRWYFMNPAMSLARAMLGADASEHRVPEYTESDHAAFLVPQVWYAHQRQEISELIADTQYLLEESPYTRAKFWSKADPARKNRSVDQWVEATKWYREYFKNEVIGHFDIPKLPPNPRSRPFIDGPKYTGYEVILDVFDDVIAYGILLVPKGIKDGERRPVVVCQHGLEGRPQDLADPRVKSPYYNQFGCRLAERGFVVFAPQNLYIFRDRFRVLQRKLNPIGKTLFSVIVPQHEQIVDWLSTLAYVDDKRIAFYGLSYGGKTAMRVPALVEKYCLSICSADFNDWVWKNASTRSPYSYVNTGEYEIFEWDLGSTFNYAEMAGLICPRPFMVERGHYDGVAPDERVASEYAKVALLYNDLKIADRTEIEFFDGPHTIHGVGTFQFLHKHLNWPSPSAPTPLNE